MHTESLAQGLPSYPDSTRTTSVHHPNPRLAGSEGRSLCKLLCPRASTLCRAQSEPVSKELLNCTGSKN